MAQFLISYSLLAILSDVIEVLLPFAVILVYYFRRRDVYDLHHTLLGLLFSVLITGVITDAIKDAVGRPQQDFFWRCFPMAKVYRNVTRGVMCAGYKAVIKEGYESFPSGHTSWSFSGLSFLVWYLSRKIRVFDVEQGTEMSSTTSRDSIPILDKPRSSNRKR